MNTWSLRPLVAGVVFALLASAATAGPVPNTAEFRSYFGYTPAPGGTIAGQAETAFNDFNGRLIVGTVSTYGFNVGRPDFRFSGFTTTGPVGSAKTFSLDDDSDLRSKSGGSSAGRFAVDGDGYWAEMEANDMIWDFSGNPLQALGFFMTDLGDFSSNVVVTLHKANSSDTETFNISTLVGGNAQNGSLAFWGFTDNTGALYDKITVSADLSFDRFGIDGVRTGSLAVPNPVPVPGTLLLAGVALALMTLRRRA